MGILAGEREKRNKITYNTAMKHTELAILSIGLLVAFSLHTSQARSVNLAPPQCHPSIISSMPPEVKKVCKALSTLYEISDTMENYLDDKVLEEILNQYLIGGKEPSRRDLDHVFLRFGR